MTKELIIKKWRSGKTTVQVAKDYMDEYNSLAYVEPIIFEFETKDWR